MKSVSILDNRDKVILLSAVILGLGLILFPIIMNSLRLYNASYGYSWVSAFWSAYNGDVKSTLISMGGSWLTLAAAAAVPLTSTVAVVWFL